MKQPNIENVPGWDEMMKKFLQSLPPEERLAGLAPEQMILALPLEVLRGFSDEYVSSLSAEAQEEIRRRLQGATD